MPISARTIIRWACRSTCPRKCAFRGGGLATYAMSYNAMVPRESERMTLICDEDLLRWHDLRVTDHLDRLVKDEPFEEAVLRQDREFVEAVRAPSRAARFRPRDSPVVAAYGPPRGQRAVHVITNS